MTNLDKSSKNTENDTSPEEYDHMLNSHIHGRTMCLRITVSVSDYKAIRDSVEFRRPDYIAEGEDIEDEAGRLLWEHMRSRQETTDRNGKSSE